LDIFLADSFESLMKENLSTNTFQKIKQKSLKLWGMTVKECISSDFPKVHFVMYDVLGHTTHKIEKDLARKMFSVCKKNRYTITIHDKNLSEKILFSYGKRQKKVILDLLRDDSFSLFDVLNHTDISQSTFYRRAQELIFDGLIIENTSHGVTFENNCKKYTSLFSGFTINYFQSNDNNIQAVIKNEFLDSSWLYHIRHISSSIKKKNLLVSQYELKDFQTHESINKKR